MVKTPPSQPLFPGRGVSLRGQFYTVNDKGQVVIRKWPRPQPTPRTQAEADNRALLAKAARFTAYMSAGSQQFAREVAAASKLLPRDLLMISLFNRLGYVIFRDGRKVYSMPAMQDVSDLLDALGQTPGDILIRGEDWWTYLPIGPENAVLAVGPDGLPIWSEVPGGGGGQEFLQVPRANPSVASAIYGGNAFAGRPIFPEVGTVLRGMKVWVTTMPAAHGIYAGLYDPATPGGVLTGATLLVQGASQAMTLGLNVLPFAAPYTVTSQRWLWPGIIVTGAGNVNFASLGYAAQNSFFTQSTGTLPSTAPTATASTSNNGSWWLY